MLNFAGRVAISAIKVYTSHPDQDPRKSDEVVLAASEVVRGGHWPVSCPACSPAGLVVCPASTLCCVVFARPLLAPVSCPACSPARLVVCPPSTVCRRASAWPLLAQATSCTLAGQALCRLTSTRVAHGLCLRKPQAACWPTTPRASYAGLQASDVLHHCWARNLGEGPAVPQAPGLVLQVIELGHMSCTPVSQAEGTACRPMAT